MFKDFTNTYPEFDVSAHPEPYPTETRKPRQPLLFLSSNDTERVLVLAQSLVRRGWVKGNYATTFYDEPISHSHKSAYHFCAMGAIMRATDDYEVPRLFGKFWREYRYVRVMRVMAESLGVSKTVFDEHAAVMRWNDSAMLDEVLAGFDKAISIAKHLGGSYAWV